MKTTEAPLMKEEKRILRKAFISRIALLFCGILPVVVFSFYILYLAMASFVEGSHDMFSYVVPVLFVLFYLGAYQFILPQYKNIFKYPKARTKQVIETCVAEVGCRQSSRTIFFYITTDCGILINTAKNVIFFMDVPALEITKGMTLYLHMIPGVENEFLRISISDGK